MPIASWCFLAFILRSAILEVFEFMSFIMESVSSFPPLTLLPMSPIRFLPILESSTAPWFGEESMLNKDDGVTADGVEGNAERAAEYCDKTRGSEKLAAAPAAAAAAAKGSIPWEGWEDNVDWWSVGEDSLIDGVEDKEVEATLFIDGFVRLGKLNCEEVWLDNKLLISIELPNPDNRGDRAAPAPAAPNAAIAKAAYWKQQLRLSLLLSWCTLWNLNTPWGLMNI